MLWARLTSVSIRLKEQEFAMNTWGVELNDCDTKATVSRLLLSDRKWCPVLIILMYSYIYHQ